MPPTQPIVPRRWQAQRGVVLISVMAGLALLAVIATSIGRDTRTGTALVRNQIDAAKAQSAADAGVHWVVDLLLRGQPVNQLPRDWEFDGSRVVISVTDAAGLIDLNRASAVTFRKLFAALDVDAEVAEKLSDAILDYRDADDKRRLNGAEDRDYRAAGKGHGAKDRAFEVIDEVRLVLGMDDTIFAAIQPALTVHGRGRRVSLALAPPLVHRAITGQDASKQAATTAPSRRAVRGLRNRKFHIRSHAETADGAVFVRRTVVALTNDGHLPFTIVEWGRGTRLD